MALLELDYLEAAMGTTFDDAGAAQAQFYIDGATSWIEDYTRISFSEVVDNLKRFRSDSYGCVWLDPGPPTAVTIVHDFLANYDLVDGASFLWDGLETISGLRSRRVYDITFSYGYASAPLSVQVVATKAVMRGLSSDPSNLKVLTVGDVTEQYGDMLDFSDADMMVLDGIAATEGTIRLDAAIDSRPTLQLPILNGPEWDTPWFYE